MRGMQEKAKVLVVDDEYAITKNLEYELKKSEYAVFTALNGDDGLALFKQEKPSVVILDIKMPGINGLKLLDIIKKDSPVTASAGMLDSAFASKPCRTLIKSSLA